MAHRDVKSNTKPRTNPRLVSGSIKSAWQSELIKKGFLDCSIQGCTERFTSTDTMESHYQWCSGGKEIICPYCKTAFIVVDQISGHIQRCRLKMDSQKGIGRSETELACSSKTPGLAALDDIIFKVTKQRLTSTDKNSKTSVTSTEKEAYGKGKAEGTHVVQGHKRVRRASCRGLVSIEQNSDANKVPMKVLEKQESTKSGSLEKGHQQNRTGSEATVKRGPGRPRKTHTSDKSVQLAAVQDNVSEVVPKTRRRKRKGTTDLNEPGHKKQVQSSPSEEHDAKKLSTEHSTTENTVMFKRGRGRPPKQRTQHVENKLSHINPNLTPLEADKAKLDPKAVTEKTDRDVEEKGSNIFQIMETNLVSATPPNDCVDPENISQTKVVTARTENITGLGSSDSSSSEWTKVPVSAVLQKRGNLITVGVEDKTQWKRVDYKTTMEERRHTFVGKYGRPRKEIADKRNVFIMNRTSVVEGSSIDQTEGQQKGPVDSTQRGIIGADTLPQKKPARGIMLSKIMPLAGQIKSPCKVVELPTSSTAAAHSVVEGSTAQKVIIPSTNLKQPTSLTPSPTSPQKVLVIENKTSGMIEQISPKLTFVKPAQNLGNLLPSPEMGSPVSESTANVAQPSTILLIKPTTETSSKLHCVQKRKGNTDVKTTTETNESKTKQGAPASSNADDTNIAINNMIEKLKETAKKNPSLVTEVMKKVEDVLTTPVIAKETAVVSSDPDASVASANQPGNTITPRQVQRGRGRPRGRGRGRGRRTSEMGATPESRLKKETLRETQEAGTSSTENHGDAEGDAAQDPVVQERARDRERECEIPQSETSGKSKRKYRKNRKKVSEMFEMVEITHKPVEHTTEAEPELTPSGRLRRGAAKRAIEHFRENLEQFNSMTNETSRLKENDGRKLFSIESDHDESDRDPDVTISSGEEEDAEREEAEAEEENEEEEDDEKDDSIDSSGEEYATLGKRGKGKLEGGQIKSPRVTAGVQKKGAAIVYQPIHWIVQQTSTWVKCHKQGDIVFTQWNTTRDQWIPVHSDRRGDCHHSSLASSTSTISFEIRHGKQRQTLISLNSLKATSHPDKAHMNAGGPVKSMAWCPTPHRTTADQYLALHAYNSHSKMHKINQLHKYDSVVQIWNCGPLNGRSPQVPRVELLIQCEFGAVWEMVWCPVRAWIHEPETQNELPRIGLLALGCSNGKVELISVPQPDSLQSEEKDGIPLYRVCEDAVVTLDPNFSDESNGQCMCLDWQIKDNCRRLMAGFANGTVHIWDLTSSSQLLSKSSRGRGLTLHPIGSYLMHQSTVTSVKFCQKFTDVIFTCSHDRYLKVWDLATPEHPINSLQKSENTSIETSLHWPVVFLGNDNCYATDNRNCVHLVDCGYSGLLARPALPHKACNTAISYNYWSNTLVSIDSAGEVTMHLLPELTKTHNFDKSFTSRRRRVFSTTISKIKPNSSQLKCNEEVNTLVTNQSDTQTVNSDCNTPTGYQDSDSVTVIYNDFDVKRAVRGGNLSSSDFEKFENDSITFQSLSALTSICWNPNFGSHQWLAVAGQAGIVRLLYFEALET